MTRPLKPSSVALLHESSYLGPGGVHHHLSLSWSGRVECSCFERRWFIVGSCKHFSDICMFCVPLGLDHIDCLGSAFMRMFVAWPNKAQRCEIAHSGVRLRAVGGLLVVLRGTCARPCFPASALLRFAFVPLLRRSLLRFVSGSFVPACSRRCGSLQCLCRCVVVVLF